MNIKKYIGIFRFSLKKQYNFKLNYLTVLFSYTIHIFVLTCLWEHILKGKLLVGYSEKQLIWYVTMAEFIMYSSRGLFRRIGEMIRNGDIANMLIRPANFVAYIFSEECSNIVQICINAVLGIMLGLIFAGFISITFIQLIFVVITVIFAIITQISLQILIGLIAFFTEENRGFYLILSKMQLLLILTPVEFYPDIIQKVFYLSPVTYSIYAPAKLLVHFDLVTGFRLLSLTVLSLLLLVLIIAVLYKKGVKMINVNGG